MAGAQFEYDEKGTTFYYFLISVFGIVLVPLTYYVWTSTKQADDKKKLLKVCRCQPCEEKREQLKKKEPKSKTIRYLSLTVIFILWVLFCIGAYKVSQFERDFTEYDPYAVLEVEKTASIAEIKRQYRRLSAKYHPDQKTGDPQRFMRIAKAHAALTNEESRKNWDMYGNPDGPGATSFGIALPSWLVSKENSLWVLAAYGLAFMIILPTVVGTWWYKSIQYSCDQILLDTSQLYFYFFHKTPNMQIKRIIMILASSMEFEKGHNNEVQERPSDNFELPELMRDLVNLGDKNKEPPLCYPYSVKARALIHAHLSRIDLPRETLAADLQLILHKSPYLVQEMVSTVAQLVAMAKAGRVSNMPRLETIENCMKISPMIVQGLWDNKSPLLQLPHISQDNLRHFTTKKRNIRSIKQLVSLRDEERRGLLRSLEDYEYENVMNVCWGFPVVEMIVKPHVLDDEDDARLITAGAIVTLTVHLKRKNLGEFFEQETTDTPEHIENVDMEDDNKEPKGSPQAGANKVWQKNKKKGKKGKPNKQQPKKKQPVKQQSKKKDEKEKSKEDDDDKKEKTKSAEDKDEEEEEEEEREGDDQEKETFSGSESESEKGDRSEESGIESDAEDEPKAKKEDDDDDEEEWAKMNEGVKSREEILEPKSKESHSVHAPYFPEDKQEWWWVYVSDKRRTGLITPPQQIFSLVEDEEVQLRFQAPEKVGTYYYTCSLRSDSYVDCDVHQHFKIDVVEAKEYETKQWDFESDEEDKDEGESGESEYEDDDEEYSD